jgi:hypothetical protein
VPHEVVPERAPGLADLPVRRELDEVGGLVEVELVAPEQAELDGRGGDALLEVERAEGEPVAEELDHEVGAGGVVGLGHDDEEDYEEDIPVAPLSRSAVRRIARTLLLCSAIVVVAALAVFRLPASQMPLLAPVVIAFLGSGLTLLSLRARERAEQDDV